MELRPALDAVCRLEIFKKDFQGKLFKTSDATGFFYTKAGTLFLITNKHVVLDKGIYEEIYEDVLRVFPTERRKFIDLDLRDASGKPLWKSLSNRDVDVVALEVPKEKIVDEVKKSEDGVYRCHLEKLILVTSFSSDDLMPSNYQYLYSEKIPLASSALVLGYPLAFHDKDYPLPIVRAATVATIPWLDLRIKGRERKPCFLIDATLHEGMSGSPVVSSPERKSQEPYYGDVHLLGVYSSEWGVGVEQLGLQNVWHAKLIDEILRSLPTSP